MIKKENIERAIRICESLQLAHGFEDDLFWIEIEKTPRVYFNNEELLNRFIEINLYSFKISHIYDVFTKIGWIK